MKPKPIEPREAMWTQANKVDLRPGDIVRFTYAAAYPNDTPIVGKVAEVDHSDYIIYFEQQPEELQKFSRTAAAPITFAPDGRGETIDLYLAPNSITARFRDLYASGARYLAKDTGSSLYWAYSDRPKWSPEHGFWYGTGAEYIEPRNPVTAVIDANPDEPVLVEEHCRFATASTAPAPAAKKYYFSREKFLLDPSVSDTWPSNHKWALKADGLEVVFPGGDTTRDGNIVGTDFMTPIEWCEEDN